MSLLLKGCDLNFFSFRVELRFIAKAINYPFMSKSYSVRVALISWDTTDKKCRSSPLISSIQADPPSAFMTLWLSFMTSTGVAKLSLWKGRMHTLCLSCPINPTKWPANHRLMVLQIGRGPPWCVCVICSLAELGQWWLKAVLMQQSSPVWWLTLFFVSALGYRACLQ